MPTRVRGLPGSRPTNTAVSTWRASPTETELPAPGTSGPNRELLDAVALVGHLVPAGTVHAFLAEHRLRLFPDEMSIPPLGGHLV